MEQEFTFFSEQGRPFVAIRKIAGMLLLKEYRPMDRLQTSGKKNRVLSQTKSDKGNTFFEMNTVVHQVKAWLRSTFSNIHEQHIQGYLDEFSFRINRSIP
jgi:hypothetical protein